MAGRGFGHGAAFGMGAQARILGLIGEREEAGLRGAGLDCQFSGAGSLGRAVAAISSTMRARLSAVASAASGSVVHWYSRSA